MIIPSEEIAYRADFALLCNARALLTACEIGTDRGVFAREFMSRWHGHQLYCVDDYQPYPEMPGRRDTDRMMAVAALQSFHGRVKFLELSSPGAAAAVPAYDRPFDFIYVDGAHDHDAVAADLAAWWPLVSIPGGILAGHDFDDSHPGVQQAVREFAERENVIIRTTRDPLASWYAYQTEPEMLLRRFFDQGEMPNPHRTPGSSGIPGNHSTSRTPGTSI